MWLSLNILSKMVDAAGIPPEEIAARLTMSTAEIDRVEYMNPFLKTVVSAKVTGMKKHPNANTLVLVDIDAGKEKYRVVCGASNFKTGDIVPLALIGTKFSDEFIIKKAKIRGEESSGMLCSEKELGISEDHSGIMILPADTKTGIAMSGLYSEWCDVRFEVDNKAITHRPDLWSHWGFAREIGALFGRRVKSPVDLSLAKNFKNTDRLQVTIKNFTAAPRYSGLLVKNIKIEESPSWLKAAVTAVGMRPINNIVDITNYVMVEIGEPMHAFDRKKLRGGEIIVRMADEGEEMTTLDGQSHRLCSEDIVIADRDGAVALAGVMGGGNSEIEPDTTEIVLEAATFNPVNIRKTAQRYGMRTEAAIRFEKSLSPGITDAAIIRCYELIKQVLPEAEAATPIVDAYIGAPKKTLISTGTDFIRKRLGEDIADEKIVSILKSLDFKVDYNKGKLEIEVPHYRATKDISIPEDIVEEVGRIFGYGNIVPSSPNIPCSPPRINEFRQFERTVKNILAFDHGMTEVSNYSFVGEDILKKLGLDYDRELRLANPLSKDQDRLRRSLIPNIARNIIENQKYHDDFRIFEFGRVFLKEDRKSKELISENTRVAGCVFCKKPSAPLFFEAKHAAAGLFERLRIKNFMFSAGCVQSPYAHPSRSAEIHVDEKFAGMVFELHPGTRSRLDIAGSAALFDIDCSLLFQAEKNEIKFIELQKFPEVPYEISVLADRFTNAGDILAVIKNMKSGNIKSSEVITVYEGNPIPQGKKSISIKIVFASREKTLTPEEIESLQKEVLKNLNAKGFHLR